MAIEMVDGEPPYFSEDPLRDRFRAQLPRQLGSTILQYSPPRIPQEREVSVVVSHINSPSDFYLQWKIQEVYRHEHGTNVEMLCPVEGQACVAKWEDGNWYRAQILGLPSHQAVLVKYVDFGNVATLTLKDIRRVKKEFLSFPEKIVFVGSACAQILEANILSVELVDSPAPPGRIFSINCQLVKEDLASYITGCPESTGVRPNEIWDVPLEIPEASEALNPRDVESMDGGDFKSLSKQELQARISHVVSPSKIFLQWLSSERTLGSGGLNTPSFAGQNGATRNVVSLNVSLQEKMATTYRESQPQPVKWERGTHCAVYSSGGSPQWTATACECLSSYLAGARVKVFLQVFSKEHLKVHLEQGNTRLDGCGSETARVKTSAALEDNIAVSESEEQSCKTRVSQRHSGMGEIYKPPFIPEAKTFQAVVSCVGCDGTIYIIPKSSGKSNFQCLGLLQPYCWAKGEACVVRGPDAMWYRGRFWQQGAVDCLQELLTHEEVEIHVQELPDNPWGKLSVSLCFEDVPGLPSYPLPPLPGPGDPFPVRVTLVVSPEELQGVTREETGTAIR
ncbi:RING finger protein 17-like [Leptosomus discolor]